MQETRILDLDPFKVDFWPHPPNIGGSGYPRLKASILDIGQQQVGLVVNSTAAEPSWMCLSGNKRLMCCRELGIRFKAMLVATNLDPAEMIRVSVTGNFVLGGVVSPGELCDSILGIRKLRSCTQAEAAEWLHLDASAASRAMSIKRLDKELLPHVENFDVCPSVAYSIASLPTLEMQRETMAKAIGPPKMSRDAVRSLVERMKRAACRGKQRRPKPLKGKLDGREFRLGLKPGDNIESVTEALKAVINRLTKHKDLPPDGWGFLFS